MDQFEMDFFLYGAGIDPIEGQQRARLGLIDVLRDEVMPKLI